ncbi:MAG: hypothetical protein U1F54_17920 [Burkholderiales bacterium]
MFRTNDVAEVPVPPPTRDGDRYWHYVEVMFQHLWFVASFTLTTADETIGRTAMLTDLSQVTRLVKERGVQLQQVVLVTPPIINGTDGLLFEELVEAWDCDKNHSPNCPMQVYRVASGREYFDSFLQNAWGALKMKRLRKVYPIEVA